MRKRIFWGALVVLILAQGGRPAAAEEWLDEWAKPLMEGRGHVKVLAGLIRNRRATNGDLIDAIEAVLASHEALQRAMRQEPKGDHGPAEKYPIQVVPVKLAGDIERFFKDAEKQFERAVALEREAPGMTPGFNLRDPVNVKAAEALGATGRRSASAALRRALEGPLLKRKRVVSDELLSTAFGALATLGHTESLQWMIREFTHSKSSPRIHVRWLAAAHAAMIRFDVDLVPGSVRRSLVERMIRTYVGVERRHASGSDPSLGDFWTYIGPGAIEATRTYAYKPLDANGRMLDTMRELSAWFRDHKNPKQPPWADS